MARSKRKESATGIYHVVTRGVNKRVIFEDDRDRERYLDYLRSSLDKSGGSLYAWCLMSNHVHLLASMELDALSAFMKSLNQRHAEYFNWKYGRVGHFYQGRFKSEPVETESYLLTVARYIHQNPVKAFMVPDCRYEWSSYGEYLGKEGLCDTDVVLGASGGLEGFLAFHSMVAFDDRCLDVVQQMTDEEAVAYAKMVLGDERFERLGESSRIERDHCLRTLKCCMLPMKQIARITGFSYSIVYRS